MSTKEAREQLPGPAAPENARSSPIKTFVMRGGRMSRAQQRSYETLKPLYGIPCADTVVDFTHVFGNDNPLVIEIGFGMGSATAEIAYTHPEINYLGIEVFKAGIGRLFWEIERRNLHNIRVIEGDALIPLEKMIPDNAASGFHIFFPDPWPKKRHHKRRLLQRPITDMLARKLKPGGYLYFVSDIEQYAVFALEQLSSTPGMENTRAAYAERQSWRAETKFERKALAEGRVIKELLFRKRLS